MADFLAIKRLAGSDLGWFASLYHKFTNTNLKGINLNADVVVGAFYRDLPVIAASTGNQVKVGVTIYGPGLATGYPGTFKLVKSGNSKNWRLNGTLVYDPREELGRFDRLTPGDIAVFAFDGRPAPTDIQIVLLAKEFAEDKLMQAFFNAMVPGSHKTMVPIVPEHVNAALGLPGVQANHPLSYLITDAETEIALEDAALGGLRGLRHLRTRRSGRPVTREEFERAKRANEQTGADGEALVNDYLTGLSNSDGSWEVYWISDPNVISPFDFHCRSKGGIMGDREFVLDVKSTKASFNIDFHMSMGEVVQAAKSDCPYYIYRVFELTIDGGKLRISEDVRTFASALLEAHDNAMPSGVTADSFSIPVDPDIKWGNSITVLFRADDEGAPSEE